MLLTCDIWANYFSKPYFGNPLTGIVQDTTKPIRALHANSRRTDTIPKRSDTIPGKLDSIPRIIDTIPGKDTLINKTDTFDIPVSTDSLDAPVTYKASDSMVLNVPD
ncbi:MAG TPA: hypothetical protein VF008_16670, partial [Niastella sp.]